MPESPIILLATRGSALALAQADLVLSQCRAAFPQLRFDYRVIRTTGDKFETASLAGGNLPKGLFTKELEVALLNGEADLAVHSLKDLPTELPSGLKLGAVGERADVRDVLIYSSARQRRPQLGFSLNHLRRGAIVGTSSVRRRAQLLALRPDFNVVDLRGNIISRLQRLARQEELDAIVLAAAGLQRLDFRIALDGTLAGTTLPKGLSAIVLGVDLVLPCVGQGALGIEVREKDERIARICEQLNHLNTEQCVTAERSFLAAMGGGCASPVAAYAEIANEEVCLRAISFPDGVIRRASGTCARKNAGQLGRRLAAALKKDNGAVQASEDAPGDATTYAHRESSAGA